MRTNKRSTTEEVSKRPIRKAAAPRLEELFAAQLEKRGLTLDDAISRGITAADANEVARMRIRPAKPAIVLPYFHPLADSQLETVRVRYFDAPIIDGKPRRYASTAGLSILTRRDSDKHSAWEATGPLNKIPSTPFVY